jgi:hypothetical protein
MATQLIIEQRLALAMDVSPNINQVNFLRLFWVTNGPLWMGGQSAIKLCINRPKNS